MLVGCHLPKTITKISAKRQGQRRVQDCAITLRTNLWIILNLKTDLFQPADQ